MRRWFGLFLDDLNGDRGVYLRVEVYPNGVNTGAPDRLIEGDAPAVDAPADGLRELFCKLLSGDASEQPAVLTCLGAYPDRRPLQLGDPCFRRLSVALGASLADRPYALGVSERSSRSAKGQTSGNQEVARVAVGHVNHLARFAQVRHLPLKDDLQRDE